MVPFKTAMDGVLAFAAKDVLPLMPNGLKKLSAYMALGALRSNPEPAVKPYEGFLKMTGIMSEDGQSVDEQRLAAAFAEAFANMSTVDFLGFTFTADDATKLVDHVTRGA
jgi:hypothetical protein